MVAARALALGVLAIAGLSLGVGLAQGADCGGPKPCSCGDRIVEDYEMKGPLGPCTGDGLRLAAGVVLDGKGFRIRGSGKKSGLLLDEGSHGARVRNVEVTGFGRGVRLAGVRAARIENLRTHHNGDFVRHIGYGIDFARGAADNLLVGVHVYENADEGIHFGMAANRNRVADSEIYDNYLENIYFLENSGNTVRDSVLRGGGAAAAYIKHAPGTRLVGNRIEDRPVQLRGRSDGVVLSGNTLRETAILLQPLSGAAPQDVRIEGGAIYPGSGACVRVSAARGVVVQDVELDCSPGVSVSDGAQVALRGSTNVRVQCRGSGEVTFAMPSDLYFVDTTGAGVAGVRIHDAAGGLLAESDASGALAAVLPFRVVRCPGRAAGTPRLVASLGSWSRALLPSALRSGMVLVPAER